MAVTYGRMSKLRAPIDCKSLELELQEDLRAAELYRLQNDAKLRAVEQNVPTYEHFRQMVNAAHLKPLDRKDVEPKVGVFLNPIIYQDNSDSSTHTLKETFEKENHADNINDKIPKTYEEFIQTWKLMKTSDVKFAYLRRTRNLLREKIFHVEIPAMLFNEVMNVCLESVQTADDVEPLIELLQILSTCNRFRLTVNFMDSSEKKLCSTLFHELLAKGDVQNNSVKESIESLAVAYNIAI